ncbi:hypothetical protein VTJ04DRAFT_8908 [Mycothermus thermophilus]|uniref:uncharacterized protein n=1 Tax=Humicola insolens TaxID=85995 RepID=UPI00374343EE
MTPAPVSPGPCRRRAPGRWMEHSTAPQQADPACAAAAARCRPGADAGEGKEVQQPHCRIGCVRLSDEEKVSKRFLMNLEQKLGGSQAHTNPP